jgi:predicted dithiol-disulfide oxidoreductase (DUF899 family)
MSTRCGSTRVPAARGTCAGRKPSGAGFASSGKYVEVKRPERLVFTWAHHATGDYASARGHETTVRLEFRPLGDKTELTPDPRAVRQRAERQGSQRGLDRLVRQTGSLPAESSMTMHRIVSQAEWLDASRAQLAKEKEFTRCARNCARERRALPWVKVEKDYVFDAPEGKVTLADLFAGKGQLIVQHFMFGPDWNEGCPSCSFWTDNFNGIDVHLAHRDTAFVLVSRGPIDRLEAYRRAHGLEPALGVLARQRLQRRLRRVVSAGREGAQVQFRTIKPHGQESPGLSPPSGAATMARSIAPIRPTPAGLDMLNGAYQLLDITSKGRDEDALPFSMAWVRRHDRY